jgi:hypothetical protein
MKRAVITVAAALCLVAAVPIAWFGYQIVNNWLAARDARTALHQAYPPGATVAHEEVHACATDDPAAPPYCGTAHVVLHGDTVSCRQTLAGQITGHGYTPLFNLDSPYDPYVTMEFVRGKDDIYVEMHEPGTTSTCDAMITYERDPVPKTHT